MNTKRILQGVLLLSMVSCDGCADEIVSDVVALGSVKFEVKRIAGAHYFTLDKGDPKDGSNAQNGYLCVNHNPGCGWWGNDGSDKFFTPDKPLPPLCTIVAVDFAQFWPDGISPQSAGGSVFGWGSYGASLTSGTPDGSVPTTVGWNNACQGPFGGQDLPYRISFLVSMPEGTDLGEDMFDQADTPSPDVCRPPKFSVGPGKEIPPEAPEPSGWSGVASYCNLTNDSASGMLEIKASADTPLPNAQGSGAMMVTNIPVTFAPSGGGVPSTAAFKTPVSFQQGTWRINQAKIVGLTGNLPGVPFNVPLPGPAGTPVLAFSGHSCVR
jgi:hypothetical protein